MKDRAQLSYWSYSFWGKAGADTSAAEENSISNVPFVFINSFWKRISARTFFRRRRNSVSMRGDWPRTGAYISWAVHFFHHDGSNTR